MKFIEVTSVYGVPILINISHINYIRPWKDDVEIVGTVIVIHGERWETFKDYEEVIALLEGKEE